MRLAFELEGYSVKLLYGEVDLTSLDPTHVAAIHFTGKRQGVLGQPNRYPPLADFLPEILCQRLHNRLD